MIRKIKKYLEDRRWVTVTSVSHTITEDVSYVEIKENKKTIIIA